MTPSQLESLGIQLMNLITDAFNRSINALERAGALDLKKMRSAYHGIGSKYYDLVTEQMEKSIAWHCPSLADIGTGRAAASLLTSHQRSEAMADQSFHEFLGQQRPHVANAFVNGDPGPLRDISTTTEPATFFGPDGSVEQGSAPVLAGNQAASRQFKHGGSTQLEIFHSGSDGDLGYWTGLQHATVLIEGKPDPILMTLRVTEIFRRENGAWKLMHRHADAAKK